MKNKKLKYGRQGLAGDDHIWNHDEDEDEDEERRPLTPQNEEKFSIQ